MKNKCDTCKHFKYKEQGDRGGWYGVCELNSNQVRDYKVYGFKTLASNNYCGKGKYEKGEFGEMESEECIRTQ